MTREEALRYLMKDGNLRVPAGRYGPDTESCAPVAYAVAEIVADATGDPITLEHIEHAMGLVVNSHDDVLSLIKEHGNAEQRQLIEDAILQDAEQAARQDAQAAIVIARAAPADEPVQFITGNAFMPPLRAFGAAEDYWQAATVELDVWSIYAESFEDECENEDVELACPDYDNVLYVVDTARFEYVDEDDSAETLSAQWRYIVAAGRVLRPRKDES